MFEPIFNLNMLFVIFNKSYYQKFKKMSAIDSTISSKIDHL